MRLPHWKSLILGVFAGLFAAVLVTNTHRLGWKGGVNGDSPDGRFTLLAMAPLSADTGGTYLISLIDKKSGSTVRHVELTVAPWEDTVELREGGGRVHWDPQSRYADLFAAGVPIVRVWVPRRE